MLAPLGYFKTLQHCTFRWLNKDQFVESALMEYDERTGTVMAMHEDGICVIEIRDESGTVNNFTIFFFFVQKIIHYAFFQVLHFEEPEFSETTGRKLHRILRRNYLVPFHEIFATDFAGNSVKTPAVPV